MDKENDFKDSYINTLPQLDVHGFTVDNVMTIVNEFIDGCYELGYKKILVIHGEGTGKLKNRIHDELKHNKFVNKFYLYNMNIGCTIIELSSNIETNESLNKYFGIQELSKEEEQKVKEQMELFVIDEIKLEYVFGKFLYDIKFDDNNRVYVLHAPNGCGKSTTLKYINNFCNNNLRDLSDGVFKEIIIKCSNGQNQKFTYSFEPDVTYYKDVNADYLPSCLLINNFC